MTNNCTFETVEAKIVIRNIDKEGRSTVYIQVCCANGIKRFPTTVKVKLQKSKSITEKSILKSATEKQQQLITKKKNDVVSVLFRAEMDNAHVTKEYLDFHLKKNIDEKNSFFEQYKKFLELHKSEWRHNTYIKHERTFTLLKEYCENCGINMTYDEVSTDFLIGFVAFLAEEYEYSNSSTKTRISDLKCFLNDCADKGLLMNLKFRKYTPYKSVNKKKVIALNEEELRIIKTFTVPEKNWKLEFARDFLVLACATGQRYESLIKLSSANISGDMLTIYQGKTKKMVEFKMNSLAKEMVEKLVLNTPTGKIKHLNNPKMNAYLTELFRDHIAPKHDIFNKEHLRIKHIGSKSIESVKKKWELIKTHTGRKTYINMMIHRGVPTKYIRSVTGHSKAEAFMVYEDNSAEEERYSNQFPDI